MLRPTAGARREQRGGPPDLYGEPTGRPRESRDGAAVSTRGRCTGRGSGRSPNSDERLWTSRTAADAPPPMSKAAADYVTMNVRFDAQRFATVGLRRPTGPELARCDNGGDLPIAVRRNRPVPPSGRVQTLPVAHPVLLFGPMAWVSRVAPGTSMSCIIEPQQPGWRQRRATRIAARARRHRARAPGRQVHSAVRVFHVKPSSPCAAQPTGDTHRRTAPGGPTTVAVRIAGSALERL
jgi:hypothetical protein